MNTDETQILGSREETKGVESLAYARDSVSQKVDAIQAAIERMPQVELPLTHRFITAGAGQASGMYIRTIFMPKGALVISKIHRTQHPFVVTKGRCSVWEGRAAPGQLDANGLREIVAGHIGITMPGTRRILYIHEDTEWTTFHATDKTTPEEVEADIIEPHDFDRDEALAQLGRMGRINGLVDRWINGECAPGCQSRDTHRDGAVTRSRDGCAT